VAKVTIKGWNPRFVQRRTKEFLFEFGPIIGYQLQKEIRDKQFDWPTPTLRKNGKFVPAGLRDIVDTGTLVKSQSLPKVALQGAEVQLKIEWTAPYSKQVLEGGYLIGTMRNAYLAPGRDWISPAIKTTDPLGYIQRRFNKLSGF
jgi:hypothetical protein